MVRLELEGERLKVEGERLVVEEERLEEEGEVERYLERIESSYNSCKLSIEKIRKYFRSSDRYLALYMNGATGDNVLEKMVENRTKHRGAGAVLGEDAPRSSYSRDRQFHLEEPQDPQGIDSEETDSE